MIRLVVVGDPIEHSLSPAIHTAALRHFGIDGVYSAERTTQEELPGTIGRIRSSELAGANVTMPLKHEAALLCDELTSDAGRTGAVNTILLRGDIVVGANTDVGGIREAWTAGGLPDGAALVLGAGGAAAAALVALEGRPLSVASRASSAAEAVLARTGVDASVEEWGRPTPGAVVVNATPLGMNGEDLPEGLMDVAAGLFDMAYRGDPTPAVLTGAARSLPVVEGKEMLVSQAILAFELWTGLRAPREVMLAAVHS